MQQPNLLGQAGDEQPTGWRQWLQRLGRRPSTMPTAATAAGDLPPALQPGSPILEACRNLRISLTAAQINNKVRPLVMISVSPGADAGVVAAGLAVALAEEGRSTLLVDADLRQPMLHTLFNVNRSPGLANALGRHFAAAMPHEIQPRLALLPAGTSPHDPTELLRMPSLARMTTDFTERYDAIVYHTAGRWPNPDAVLLARQVGAAVLILRAGIDQTEEVRRLKTALERAEVELLGFAMLDEQI